LAWALLFWTAGWISLLARLRFSQEAAALAWPVLGASPAWPIFPAFCLTVAVLTGWLDRRILADKAARRAFLELLALVTVALGYEWAFLPAFDYRVVDVVFLIVLAGVLVGLLIRDSRSLAQMGLRLRGLTPAIRWLALPTLLAVGGCGLVGWAAGAQIDTRKLLVSVLTYPFYALAQLIVLLVLLTGRLEKMKASGASILLVTAGMFALVHWPNGPLMAGCFLMGLVWTGVHLRGPQVLACALSMGLAASGFARLLPVQWTQNMRTGPIYVRRGLEWQRHPPPR
jgi:hypothetical protein